MAVTVYWTGEKDVPVAGSLQCCVLACCVLKVATCKCDALQGLLAQLRSGMQIYYVQLDAASSLAESAFSLQLQCSVIQSLCAAKM